MDKSLVMIIEDEEAINEALLEVAKMSNYEVVQAYNGKEAIELLTNKKMSPALVLCDMGMPVNRSFNEKT